jgi:methylenetetrahydrofolate reductase (NADPH)
MNCPKGLRNGPCGGTLGGKCEVYEDKACVWVVIQSKVQQDGKDAGALPLHAPFDPGLLGTPSYLNAYTEADAATRKPVASLDLPTHPHHMPPQTGSALEAKLLSGRLVLTAEVCSPRTAADFGKVEKEVSALAPFLDAFNATSNQGGVETVSSLDTARVIMENGGEPILQICARDVDPRSFLDQVEGASAARIRNILCLTGDWSQAVARKPVGVAETHRRIFKMDSSQMVYDLRHRRLTGESAFVKGRMATEPHPYVGAVINPFTTPQHVLLSRLAQKVAVGAEFFQTQVVFDAAGYIAWVREVERLGLRDRMYLIPSSPIVTRPKPLAMASKLKGVWLPEDIKARLEGASDLEAAGMDLARSIMKELLAADAADGFHLTRFGARNEHLIALTEEVASPHQGVISNTPRFVSASPPPFGRPLSAYAERGEEILTPV